VATYTWTLQTIAYVYENLTNL